MNCACARYRGMRIILVVTITTHVCVGTIIMLKGLLWRLWKWLLHWITGHCELYRICVSDSPVEKKAPFLVQSLQFSQHKVLQNLIVEKGSRDVTAATKIVIRKKNIQSCLQGEFKHHFSFCLTRVYGVRDLKTNIELERAEQYNQINLQHEAQLMKLWSCLQPDTSLTQRITNQWQEIGFQGKNPATDFRGMGVLGLHCLVYFAEQHQDKARSVLLQSKHPQYWYPFAIVGIAMTSLLYNWLISDTLDAYIISSNTTWPPHNTYFYESVSFVIYKFSSFWSREKPQSIMEFTNVKEKFAQQLKLDVQSGSVTMTL